MLFCVIDRFCILVFCFRICLPSGLDFIRFGFTCCVYFIRCLFNLLILLGVTLLRWLAVVGECQVLFLLLIVVYGADLFLLGDFGVGYLCWLFADCFVCWFRFTFLGFVDGDVGDLRFWLVLFVGLVLIFCVLVVGIVAKGLFYCNLVLVDWFSFWVLTLIFVVGLWVCLECFWFYFGVLVCWVLFWCFGVYCRVMWLAWLMIVLCCSACVLLDDFTCFSDWIGLVLDCCFW